MNFENIMKLFDSYNRIARLYPAVLAIAPILWTLVALFPGLLTADIPRGVISAVGFACVLYLFSNIARSRGKAVEQHLIARWGEWPSTMALRHRDRTFDRYTTVRYHERLRALTPDLRFPSPDEEAAAPADADAVYRSATKRLIELRRGLEHRMLHAENASYGFRRNMLGLKPVGIAIMILVMVVTIFIWWHGLTSPALTAAGLATDAAERWQVYALFAVDLAYLGIWLFIVRPAFVMQAGNEYAQALFRTLE